MRDSDGNVVVSAAVVVIGTSETVVSLEVSPITICSVVVASAEVPFSVETSEGSAVVVIFASVIVISSLVVVSSISACSDVVVGTASVEVSMPKSIIASETPEGRDVVVVSASVGVSVISSLVLSSISVSSDVVVDTVSVEATEVNVEVSIITVDSVVVIMESVAVVVISASLAISVISCMVVSSASTCLDVVIGTVSVEAIADNVEVSMMTACSVVVIIASVEVSVTIETLEGSAVVVSSALVVNSVISCMVVSSMSVCSGIVVVGTPEMVDIVSVEVSMIIVGSDVVIIASVEVPCSVVTPEGSAVVVITESIISSFVVPLISAFSDVVAGTVSVEVIVVGIPVKLSSVGSMRDSDGKVVSRTPSVVCSEVSVEEASDVMSTTVVTVSVIPMVEVSDTAGIKVVSLISICGTAVCSDVVSIVDDDMVIEESVVCTGTVVSKLRGDALLVDSVDRSVPLVDVSEVISVMISLSISRSSGRMVVDVIGTIESVVSGKIVVVSSSSVAGFSVVDKLGSKVEIASVIKSKILEVVVSTGSSVTNVVAASLPRGSGYMNSSSAGTVVSIRSVTRESESGIPTGGAVWVTISGTSWVVSVDMLVVSTTVVLSAITVDGPVAVIVTPVVVSVVSISVETSEGVANVVTLASTEVVGREDVVGTVSVEVPVVSIRIVVSPSVGPVVVIAAAVEVSSDGVVVTISDVVGTASVEVLVVSIRMVVSTSVGPDVVITSAVEVSTDGVVISAPDVISNISSVVVSSMAISEGFRVVEGKVSVEAIDTSSTVDISVIISDGAVVVSISPIDVSVIMSGNMRDSDGKVVVIISVVWASVVVVINVVLWSWVVEVIDSIAVSNSSASVMGGGDVLARMASVVVTFMSTFIVVLSVTIWADSGEVEI